MDETYISKDITPSENNRGLRAVLSAVVGILDNKGTIEDIDHLTKVVKAANIAQQQALRDGRSHSPLNYEQQDATAAVFRLLSAAEGLSLLGVPPDKIEMAIRQASISRRE